MGESCGKLKMLLLIIATVTRSNLNLSRLTLKFWWTKPLWIIIPRLTNSIRDLVDETLLYKIQLEFSIFQNIIDSIVAKNLHVLPNDDTTDQIWIQPLLVQNINYLYLHKNVSINILTNWFHSWIKGWQQQWAKSSWDLSRRSQDLLQVGSHAPSPGGLQQGSFCLSEVLLSQQWKLEGLVLPLRPRPRLFSLQCLRLGPKGIPGGSLHRSGLQTGQRSPYKTCANGQDV